ncbi:serine hydrolase domain-containing protein [Hymenobacter weizhouensis]|uniref:serine hydrolase domain-containing protein n=1 Tax=Hymenobacter sp. YIM 151500-1 TaxID=2987689 RepID=UPI0022261894|nr:serine hydrolase domain-containing protein [Hymenobacter sp. YIM 151500-1]UYZ61632.1 beta-lactamase family protein [Hymenobacter sp. YIM 151500-1]
MKKLLALLLGLLTSPAWAQTGVSAPELAPCDAAVQKFMKRWDIPGASVAIARHGKLVYARGFGHANLARTEPMTPAHLLRVASVSKPVTAVAVMKLVEQGRLDLRHTVFGPGGYLNQPYYSDVITDRRIYAITVQQLLEHSAGWNRNAGVDGFSSSDPIDFPLHVAQAMHVPNPVGDSTLVRYLLSKGLNFTPGTRFAYSNIGYLVLGKIIEQVTGQRYETWVRRHVLEPSGVLEAHLGRNLRADKVEREAEYFCDATNKSCYGTGKRVPFAYGGANLEAMNAHGGWLFTARDLVRLLLAVDGLPTRPDILQPATLDTMTTPSEASRRYAKGWMVNRRGMWWHTGCLNGSASCVVRTADGYTWAILLNSFPMNANRFWDDLEDLGWACVGGVDAWPTHDLFAPEHNAAQLQVTASSAAATTLAWARGSGSHSLLVVREDKPVDAFAQDGQAYTASRTFGLGDVLGKGNVVVAAGADSTVQIRGLRPGHTYHARVMEYSANEATGQQPVYTLEGNPVVRFRVPEAAPVAKAKARRPSKAVAGKLRAKKPTAPAAAQPAAPSGQASRTPRATQTSYLLRLRSVLSGPKG